MQASPPASIDPDSLPRRALVFAACGDDAARLRTGLLAELARRGIETRLAVVTASAGEGPDGASNAAAGTRVQLGLAAGTLAGDPELVAKLSRLLDDDPSALVAAPLACDDDLERRALACALASALARGPARRVLACAHDARPVAGNPTVGDASLVPGCVALTSAQVLDWLRERLSSEPARASLPRTTAVVSTWNKKDDVCANLDALRAQTLPFAEIVVVDNASRDGTAELLRARYPDVRLIVMPHERFGACETFNIGFKASRTELTAILDDDIVMPPDWLEKATLRMQREPATTAIVSTQVREPGMPRGYLESERHNSERYMSTFRGCASLARSQALAEAGYYDERLFIYGNERDLTCRLLNLGYRVLQYPGCGVFHKTPFGIKMGKRSLYYHARNAWLSMLKYAPLGALARMPFLVLTRVVLRGSKSEAQGAVTDATGTIGIGKSLRETPGAWWIVTKAAFSVLANVPYCLKRRAPVRSSDFELPLS